MNNPRCGRGIECCSHIYWVNSCPPLVQCEPVMGILKTDVWDIPYSKWWKSLECNIALWIWLEWSVFFLTGLCFKINLTFDVASFVPGTFVIELCTENNFYFKEFCQCALLFALKLQRALAASLGLRTTLTLSEAFDDVIRLDLPDIGIKLTWLRHELSSFSWPSSQCFCFPHAWFFCIQLFSFVLQLQFGCLVNYML